MIKYITAIVVLMFVGTAYAAEQTLSLDLNLTSNHTTDGYYENGQYIKYNSKNRGAGVTYFNGENTEVFTGWYSNSYYQKSVYLGVNFVASYKFGKIAVRPGLAIGGVSGYLNTPQQTTDGMMLMVLPNVSVGVGDFSVKVGYVPAVGDKTGYKTLQVNWKVLTL